MSSNASDLSARNCKPCEGGMPPLTQHEIDRLMHQLAGWEQDGDAIGKVFRFRNYYETMAFVNATAWISHRENHHPDLLVSYRECRVRYTTHVIGGLSENDFICAAKVDALLNA